MGKGMMSALRCMLSTRRETSDMIENFYKRK